MGDAWTSESVSVATRAVAPMNAAESADRSEEQTSNTHFLSSLLPACASVRVCNVRARAEREREREPAISQLRCCSSRCSHLDLSRERLLQGLNTVRVLELLTRPPLSSCSDHLGCGYVGVE